MFDEWVALGQPTCSVLGLLKTVPVLGELDQKRPYVVCMKLFKMNGLSCIGISRLMHKLCVLIRGHNYMEYNCVYRPLEMKLLFTQLYGI